MSYQYQKVLSVIISIFILALAIVYFTEQGDVKNTQTIHITNSPTVHVVISPTPQPTQTPIPLPLTGLKILIDPAHQKASNRSTEPIAPWDNTQKIKCSDGTHGIVSKIQEYELNLSLSLILRDLLTKNGAEVIMTRTDNDVNISNIERAEIANKENVDLVFRIHHNGYENQDINGIEIYSRGKGDGSDEYIKKSQQELNMAQELLECLILATGANKRYAKQDDSYTSINWTNAPCFIVEVGYVTNPAEEQRLISDSYKVMLAEGFLYWLKTSNTFKFN